MKLLSKISFWEKHSKLSFRVLIVVGLLLTVAISPQLTKEKLAFFEPLPIWEVNNPVSKVFVMDEIPPTAGSLAAGDSTVPNEYLIDPAIDTLLLLMETQGIYFHKTALQPSGIVGSDNIVIIKGNFQWKHRNTTNTDRIKGVIWKILNHPEGFNGEIIVCDNTQDIGTGINLNDDNSEDVNQSIIDVVNTFYSKGYPVYLIDWNYMWDDVVNEYSENDYNDGFTYDPISKITYPKFLSPSGDYYISLRYGIWNETLQEYDKNKLCLIDFPVLKAHGMAGATIALKNWVGVLTTAYKDERYGGYGAMHSQYFFGQYALVTKVMGLTYPKLTIVDAEWTNPTSNWQGESINTKMLLGSTDACAASWYASKFMLTPIAYSPDDTDPDNPNGKYYNCIVPWTDCLQDSGFAVTIDSSEISVYNRSVLSTTLTFNLTVFISDGWNMVSVPGENPNGQGVANWWPGRTGDVFKYSNGYQVITTTTPGEGYWMKHLGTNEYNTGDEWPAGGIEIVAHNPINATTGWNMIGGYEDTVLTSNITTTPPGLIEGPIYKYANGFQIAEEIVPGYGYFLKLSENGQIHITAVSEKVKEGLEVYFPKNWGKMIFSDAKDISYTLYAINGEVDLNQYELPPAPPEGMFDIRFSSGRIAEDINSSVKEIDLRGVTYPLTVKAENMDMRVMDETGKIVNVNLKKGEDVVINNPTVHKLMVSGELIPDKYALEQNYPNPFNPRTSIKFAIPKESDVNLSVYNVLGELVITLVNGQMKSGYYEYEFNAALFSSGVYLYRIKAGDFIQTKKMLLMK